MQYPRKPNSVFIYKTQKSRCRKLLNNRVYLKDTMQEITTIKLQKTTKEELDEVRKSHESYDVAIKSLLAERRKEHLKEALREGYTSRAVDDKEILKEWGPSSSEVE